MTRQGKARRSQLQKDDLSFALQEEKGGKIFMSSVLVRFSFFFTFQVKENNRSSKNLLEFYNATKVVTERSRSIRLARPETCQN